MKQVLAIYQKKFNFSNKKIILNTLIAIFYFLLIFFLNTNILWAINDDAVIDQIINSKSSVNQSIVSFMSLLLGYMIAAISKVTNFNNSYGVFIVTCNLILILVFFNIFITFKNRLIRNASIFILFLMIPYLILNPTYTITSILLSFSGVFLILNLIKSNKKSKLLYLFAGVIFALGISIRLDSYKGVFVFFGLYLLTFIFFNFKKVKFLNIFISILPFAIIMLIQTSLSLYVSSANISTDEYLKFQNIRHELFYTPAILKMHQKVIAGEILPQVWGDVEISLLRNWVYADQSVYNSTNLKVGKDSVREYIGIKGFLNSDAQNNFDTVIYYLNDVKLILYFILIFLIFSFVVSKKFTKILYLNTSLILGYFISFMYAAAVLRLPIRVTFPYLILFGLLTLFNLEIVGLKNYYDKKYFFQFFNVIFILIFIWFNLYKSFGFINLLNVNQNKILWAKQRDSDLLNFQKNAVYIAPMAHLPLSQTGPFINQSQFKSINQTLSLDWSTFSPTWKSKANDLGLDSENIYRSLAKTKSVFLVAEPGLASVMDMYMNDHEILRGKRCAISDLSGFDNAKIFTYQAKASDC